MSTVICAFAKLIFDKIYRNLNPEKACIEDFEILSVIGQGVYSKVYLAKKVDNGYIFALKVTEKIQVQEIKQIEHIKTERDVLVSINHPFIVKLAYAFQNQQKLFFAMEYCPGGELFNLILKLRKLSESQVRFYTAQIILAIEKLHSENIIYRDLKPENILIDKEGYIRVADFGLSRQRITSKRATNTICGTLEYLAPEIIMKFGHGKPVDWWTLGCFIYELLVGHPPFRTKDNNNQKLFEQIQFGTVNFPSFLSKNSVSLIQSLLIKNPGKRLGSQGAKEIINHPFYEKVKWSALLQKKLPAPFIPIITKNTDVTNFDQKFTEQPLMDLKLKQVQSKKELQNYDKWTWNNSISSTFGTKLSQESQNSLDNSYKKDLQQNQSQVQQTDKDFTKNNQ